MTQPDTTLLITPGHPLHPFHEKPLELYNKAKLTTLTYRCVEAAFLATCFQGLEIQKRFQDLSAMEARDLYDQIVESEKEWANSSTYGLRPDLTSTSVSGLTGTAVIMLRVARVKFSTDEIFRAFVMKGKDTTYRFEPIGKKLKPWPTDMWWLYCITELRLQAERSQATIPSLAGVAAAP